MFSRTSVVSAAKGHISCDLAGEVVLLSLSAGAYYGLDAVGSDIWSKIQEPKAILSIRDLLVEDYDVDPETCERDLMMLLEDLEKEGFLEVRDEWPG